MPISRLQFEMGIDAGIEALMVSVCDLLEANPDSAYSEEELYDLFTANAPGSYIDASYLDIALQKVVELGAVEARAVANAKYYAFLQVIDRETWELAPDESEDDSGDETPADGEHPHPNLPPRAGEGTWVGKGEAPGSQPEAAEDSAGEPASA